MDRKPEPGTVWNRLRPAEKTKILETALQQPDLSPRELACSKRTPARTRRTRTFIDNSAISGEVYPCGKESFAQVEDSWRRVRFTEKSRPDIGRHFSGQS